MAFTPYHNIVESTGGKNQQLVSAGDNASTIYSILLTNVHATADATVSLYISNGTDTYYIIKTVAIPSDTPLLLDNMDMLSFDNSSSGYDLNITIAASDTVDVMIKK